LKALLRQKGLFVGVAAEQLAGLHADAPHAAGRAWLLRLRGLLRRGVDAHAAGIGLLPIEDALDRLALRVRRHAVVRAWVRDARVVVLRELVALLAGVEHPWL